MPSLDSVLSGRHAVVTGGSRGIGEAIATTLLARGARVTITGRDEKRLADTAARIGAEARVLEATDEAAVVNIFAALEPVDILVANAGGAETAKLGATKRDLWDRMLAVNLTGVFLAIRAVLPGMTARGQGRIIAVASTAGLKGYAYAGAYCAAKHGVIGLVRATALECARSGVTVNAVCPGYVDTDIIRGAVEGIVAKTGRAEAEALAHFTATNPQGRLIRPEEVAATVAWLAGPGTESITGQAIAIAGGEVM